MALTQAQIQTAFQNSLGRAPTSNELSSYTAVSASGALSDAAIYSTISNSQEANLIADPVIRFYLAAFGRVPDQAGLQNAENFVRAFTPTAATYQDLATQFTTSQEFTNRYGAGTTVDAAFVQSLYTNILGRQGSANEIAGYTSGSNGYTTRAQVFYAISQSQEAINITDTAVNNFEFAAAQGTASYVGALPGLNANVSTVNLTTGVDNLVGTQNGDSYNAILGSVAGGQQATLNSFDTILDQGGTNDVLNILVNDAGQSIPAGTKFSGIETVNFDESANVLGGTLDGSAFQGTTLINQSASGANKFVSVTNVQAGEVISFTSTDGTGVIPGTAGATDTVKAAAGVTSETVSITKVVTGGVVSFGETTGGDVTSVTLNGSVNADGNVTVNTADLTSDATVKLGITSNSIVKFAGSADTLTTIDASTSTGNLNLDTTGTAGFSETYTKLNSVTGGQGSDTLKVTLANHDSSVTTFTVNSGAGNDTINFNTTQTNAAAATVTGGTGGDAFTFTATGGVANLVLTGTNTDTQINKSLITVSDFGNGTDVLDISNLGANRITQNTVTNAVDTAVNAATTNKLAAAVNAASGQTTAVGDVAAFQYGGETYVFVAEHAGGGAAASGDALIKLAGVSLGGLTAANFVP